MVAGKAAGGEAEDAAALDMLIDLSHTDPSAAPDVVARQRGMELSAVGRFYYGWDEGTDERRWSGFPQAPLLRLEEYITE